MWLKPQGTLVIFTYTQEGGGIGEKNMFYYEYKGEQAREQKGD